MNKKSLAKYIEELSMATPAEKDFIVANILVIVEGYLDLLEKMVNAMVSTNPKVKKLSKEIKEIEDTISLGIPGWIKYTRKVKKSKKS